MRLARATSDPASTLSVLRQGCLCILLLSGLAILYLGVRMLAADINANQATRFIDDWSDKGEIPSTRAWQIARRASERAVHSYPVVSGEYLELQGNVYEWRDFFLPPGDPDADASRSLARQSYRQAIESRPQWPYSWSRLAVTKMKLQEYDAEFDTALRNSVALGPWRPDVSFQIAEVGLRSWEHLSKEQKQLVVEAIRRLAKQNERRAGNLISFGIQAQLDGFDCSFFDVEASLKQEVC